MADASYSTAKSRELFYDSLCKCDDNGIACNRDADCCDAHSTCFGDPAQGGKHICRECGQSNYTDTCNTDKDCCDGICTSAPAHVCVEVPDPNCTSSSGGSLNLCLKEVCTDFNPTTPVCQPKSVVPPTK